MGHLIQEGLQEYKRDVQEGVFPSEDFSPYAMSEDERSIFERLLEKDEEDRRRKHDEAAEKYVQTDEYEKLHLYGSQADNEESTTLDPTSSH